MKGFRRLALAVAMAAVLATAAVAVAADAAATVQQLDTAAYPEVGFVLSLPAGAPDAEPRVTVAENGEPVTSVEVAPLTGPAAPASVVLVLDASGSMQGSPLEHAKDAARAFIDAMGDEAKIAIISFSDQPAELTAFTDQRDRLDAAVSSLDARGETALYDALVAAAGLMSPNSSARQSIIVLSDGADTASASTFTRAMDVVRRSGAPVYSVALKSDEYNPKALETLSRSSGGRLVPASRTEELASLFEGIAEEISRAYRVSYTSPEPDTKDIELDIEVVAGGGTAVARVAYPNPSFDPDAETPFEFSRVADDPWRLTGFLGLAFASVGLLALGGLLMVFRERSTIDQLRYYDQLQAVGGDAAEGSPADVVRSRVIDAVGHVAGRRGLMSLVSSKLESAGLPLRPAEYITGHVLAVVVLGVATEFLTGRLALAIIVVILLTFGPIIALDIAVDRRRAAFEGQLPDVLNMISGSLRAGWGIQQAISLVAQDAASPSSVEFRRVDTEVRLGMPLERALQSMAARLGSTDFKAAVGAITIQREVGGNLAEVLDIVATTIRDRDALRRHVKSLTAEGRLSAYILIALPFLVVAIMLVVSPSFLSTLFTTGLGLALLFVAVVLLVVGSFWLYRVTRIEV